MAKTETAGGDTHTHTHTHSYAYNYDTVGRLLTVTRDGDLVESYNYDLSGHGRKAPQTLVLLSRTDSANGKKCNRFR